MLKRHAWHNTILNNLILGIYFATLVMFYVIYFSQLWCKLIIFSHFGQEPFSKTAGKPPAVLSKDKLVLLKDTTQWCRWGSNLRPLGLQSSTEPLCSLHLALLDTSAWVLIIGIYFKLFKTTIKKSLPKFSPPCCSRRGSNFPRDINLSFLILNAWPG